MGSRIGILTYHRSINYGAVMQSAALAEELIRRFPYDKVEIVDYCSRRMDLYYKLTTLYRGRASLAQLGGRIAMYRAFRRGVKRLPRSKDRLTTDNCAKFWRWLGDRYDVLITGSDAVWNYNRRGLPNPYFLTGAKRAKLFSYAASCNGLAVRSFSEISPAARETLARAFERLRYIGTRDLQTERMVLSVCPSARPVHNCDPSLFFRNLPGADKARLMDRMRDKYGVDFKRPLIGLMLSNLNGDFGAELVKRLRASYGGKYQIVSIYAFNRDADVSYLADLTPAEWSVVFSLFRLTISKYFHGTAFSLLNDTQVLAVGAESSIDGLPNKIEDMLGRMELMDLYFPARSGADIDWAVFMDRLDSLLREPPIKRMRAGIERERTSAESFFQEIRRCLAGED
jgi:hypothetical protein